MATDGIPAATRPTPRAAGAREAARPRALAAAGGSLAQRLALRDAALAWLATHLVVWGAGLVGLLVLGIAPDVRPYDPAGLTTPFGALGDRLVAPAARWDSVWFLSVARDGYGSDIAKPAFFPLYPLLVRAAGVLVGSPLVGGLLVSWACLGGALYLLRRLTALELGDGPATHAVWLVALFPAALYGSAVYSESLFLLLSVGAVLAMRTGHVARACVIAALATATRSAGIVLVVPLALLLLREGRRPTREWLWLLVVPAGLVAFAGWLEATGNGWRAAFDAQAQWLREFAGPFVGAWDGLQAGGAGLQQVIAGGGGLEASWMDVVLAGFLLLALPALIGAARRLPLAYAAYALAALAMPLSYPVDAQPLMSLPRFEWVLFPLFMWGGWWLARRGWPVRAVVYALCVVGLCVLSARFAAWRWVA